MLTGLLAVLRLTDSADGEPYDDEVGTSRAGRLVDYAGSRDDLSISMRSMPESSAAPRPPRKRPCTWFRRWLLSSFWRGLVRRRLAADACLDGRLPRSPGPRSLSGAAAAAR